MSDRGTLLQRYLDRIGLEISLSSKPPRLELLRAVHRRHVLAIPYENLDVVSGTAVSRDPRTIHRKLVECRRGGWCYEMNGLLAWALSELGFQVTQLAGAVMRRERGDLALGNHLVLRVDLEERPWIADVGLGDGLLEPIPLCEDTIEQGDAEYRLERLDDEAWRFHNRIGAFPSTFDFFDRPAEQSLLEAKCRELQTSPESMFVQNLICQRRTPDGTHLLLGRVLREAGSDRKQLLHSLTDLERLLDAVFDLRPTFDERQWHALWEKVERRHEQLFGDTAVDEIQIGTSTPPERPLP